MIVIPSAARNLLFGPRRMLTSISACLLLMLVALPATAALAHESIWDGAGGDTQVPDIVNAYAWPRQIAGGPAPQVFVIESEGEERLLASMIIPRVSGLEEFQVNMVLLGPGLPPIIASDLPSGLALPQDQSFGPVCAGTGSGVVAATVDGEEFFDAPMLAGYRRTQSLDVELPDFGTYYLYVSSADDSPGKYVLETGRVERSGTGRLLSFPAAWVKTQLFLGRGTWLISGLVLLAALGIAAGTVVARRRHSRLSHPPDGT